MPNALTSTTFEGSVFLGSSNVAVAINRLNQRARVIVAGNKHLFEGRRVLDLASHDGRFSHLALACGASHVTGVEVREAHVQSADRNLAAIGHPASSYKFIQGDLVDFLRKSEPGAFDTILCFGVLAHLIETVEVFREVQRLQPKTFMLDGWQAREKLNLVERMRNHWVTEYVSATQLGGAPMRRSVFNPVRRLWQSLREPGYATGTLVFLYEDPTAAGATMHASGLMAWPTGSLIQMLFSHFGFEAGTIDWHAQGITDWTDIDDYRRGDRHTWIAAPNGSSPPLHATNP